MVRKSNPDLLLGTKSPVYLAHDYSYPMRVVLIEAPTLDYAHEEAARVLGVESFTLFLLTTDGRVCLYRHKTRRYGLYLERAPKSKLMALRALKEILGRPIAEIRPMLNAGYYPLMLISGSRAELKEHLGKYPYLDLKLGTVETP